MPTWTCPYCRQKRDRDAARDASTPVTVGRLHKAVFHIYSCENPDCRRSTLVASLYERTEYQLYDQYTLGTQRHRWALVPAHRARPWRDYVPQEVQSSYREACATGTISPNASAALSRRCLQAIICDYFGVVGEYGIIDEINKLEATVGADTDR